MRHRIVLFELSHHVGHGRGLLPDGNVNTYEILPFLVDDGINRQRRLAGLTVADDQLALTPTDRHHRVNRLQSCLHRL